MSSAKVKSHGLLGVLFLVKVLDAVAGVFVLTEVEFVFISVELTFCVDVGIGGIGLTCFKLGFEDVNLVDIV